MDAYEWGRSAGPEPFSDEDATRRFMALSAEEKRAFIRGRLDATPAAAPLPLPVVLAFHAVGLACVAEVWERGARWYHWVAAAPVMLGIGQLKASARNRIGRRRARAVGIEVRADVPRVPQRTTILWGLIVIAVSTIRWLVGRPRRRQTPSEMIALQASMDLVEWWTWRPNLRRRAAPRA